MKYAALLLLALSFTSFASEEVPCQQGENICVEKANYNPFSSKTNIYSRGVALGNNYGAAQDQADARIEKAFPGRHCGFGVSINVQTKKIRFRDGREGIEAWYKCSPEASMGDQGDLRSGRQGTMLCGPGGKGCIIVK